MAMHVGLDWPAQLELVAGYLRDLFEDHRPTR